MVEVEVANNDGLALVRRGMMRHEQARRQTIRGVGSGATMLVLPQAVARQLDLPFTDDAMHIFSSKAEGEKLINTP